MAHVQLLSGPLTLSKGQVAPSAVRYIKLGARGGWERECLDQGIIRIGFGSARPDRFSVCQSGRWEELAQSFVADGKSSSLASRFTRELRLFFEDAGTTLWITFMNDQLYWGFTAGQPKPHPDGDGVWRPIRSGWKGTDILGSRLVKDRLSGRLAKLAAYRGTSCQVDASEYVIRRINGLKMPQVENALAAYQQLADSVPSLLRLLTWQDFELLVDLIFTTSGWRRLGVVGKTQDTKDLDLVLPSTGERAFVQVKSSTTAAELKEYVAKLTDRVEVYDRMFYVYHSGDADAADDPRVTVIGPDQLAEMVITAGLMDWLIEKAS